MSNAQSFNSSTISNSSTPNPKALVGWVPESAGRGTLTLVATCLFTIFLCTWVVIHPRVTKTRLHASLFKLALFSKTILAPEFIAVEGLQEWTQCRRMVKECATITDGEFKLIHAFYISMLALRYRTPKGDKVIWPNQFTWLLHQELVSWKDHARWGLDEDLIRDKSNADGAVKVVALCQVLWFVAACIMRAFHDLPISQIESMTLSYIPLFATTYYLWWLKPKDIATASLVDLPTMSEEQMVELEGMAVNSKFDDEGLPEQTSMWNVWSLTPRVFEKEARDKEEKEALQRIEKEAEAARNAKIGGLHTLDHIEICDSILNLIVQPLTPRKKEIVVAHWDPLLYRSKLWPLCCLMGASFGAIHLISWNTSFPSIAEAWLWRISALVSIVSMLVFMHFEKTVLRWGGPLHLISILSPALYFVSRVVMIAEVVAALRAEDPAIYETYVVSSYWVHLL